LIEVCAFHIQTPSRLQKDRIIFHFSLTIVSQVDDNRRAATNAKNDKMKNIKCKMENVSFLGPGR
jgi:hypothetical protein